MIGKTISHYKILEKLGEGGMGVVYKAEDTKLNRQVALKFLPSHLTKNETDKARFLQEAQAAAALNHNNVCTIHEIHDEGENPFIVMEYVEGKTLRDVVGSYETPMPLQDVTDTAIQIAEALKAAHKKGIVHRDIKSENIMVTETGQVKVMDFGLAKLRGSVKITKTSTTIGTIAYMSPEHLQGKDVDACTDIFSFGVVLYEMLTGQLPFKGEYDSAMMYSILNEDPEPVTSSRPDIPEALAKIVHRTLRKKKEARYSSMTELLDYLRICQKDAGFTEGRLSFKSIVRQPRIVIPGVLILLALGVLIVSWYNRNSKVHWALKEALPEIERLAAEDKDVQAYDIAVKAERYLPDDSTLIRLWPNFTWFATIHSDPPGASVFWNDYRDIDREWTYLGKTPIDSIRLPYSAKLKLEKEGYGNVYAVAGHIVDVDFILDEEGGIPDDMVRVPGGTYRLRFSGLGHLDRESIKDFLMDKYEITNRAYKRFVESGGYQKQEYWKNLFLKDGRTLSWEEAMALFTDKTGRPGPATWEVGDYPEGEDDYPVMGVSWYEAAAYAEFAGRSLPTIYHWNRAAGIGRLSSMIIPLSNLSGSGPTPVGYHQGMSAFGTYDMAGNVREWCWNEIGRDGQRSILGGGWSDPAYAFSSAYAQPTFNRSPLNGFRCIKYLEREENISALSRVVDRPYRDFSKEKPVSDETFNVFLRMYAYDKKPLNTEIEYEDNSERDWIKQKITFDAAYGNERIIAHLYLPKRGAPPYQTVVYFPGSGVIQLKSSEDIKYTRLFDFLMKGGRAVMYPIYKGTFERGDELKTSYPDESIFYRDHVIMWAKDLGRSIDYLETRNDINIDKLAYYGFSWGGRMGANMLAIEKRIKVGILYVAGLRFKRSLPEVDHIHFLPRVSIPVLMLNGKYDYIFPVETLQKPFYELLGTPDEDKRWVIYEGDHSVPRVVLVKETLDWLDRYLGEVK